MNLLRRVVLCFQGAVLVVLRGVHEGREMFYLQSLQRGIVDDTFQSWYEGSEGCQIP